MLTEEPTIGMYELHRRWPGMDLNKMLEMARGLFDYEGGEFIQLYTPETDMQERGIPWPYMYGTARHKLETNEIKLDIEPIYKYLEMSSAITSWECAFKLSEIEYYEKKHPKVKWPIIDLKKIASEAGMSKEDLIQHMRASEAPADDNSAKAPAASEYITADEARRQRNMSPTVFAEHLIGYRTILPLEGLTSRDRDYFYGEETPIEEARDMLHKISIHRRDWENHLQLTFGPAKAKGPGAGEEIAQLGKRHAELLAEKIKADTRIAELEAELARERQARTDAEEAANKKVGLEGTIKRLRKILQAWKAAPAWMIPAAIAVYDDGPKDRSRDDLKPFARGFKGPTKGTHFEVWRLALPAGYHKKKPGRKSKIDDESVDR